ncbi:MAG TPA: phosphoribosyltransferase family protein, partial [Bradyrhizobium sp.]|nr:phosphoribosyltransferase family protein [Bradyrhizobium sp.]
MQTITSSSLDPQDPLFQPYPSMKLGVRESVRFYANLLVPLAEKIVASQPETTDWVITAPPLYVIPAGANLIASAVFQKLRERLPRSQSLRLVEMRYALPMPASTPELGGDYSNSDISARIRNRQRLHEGDGAPRPSLADFEGRAVLFINDINVTGTQQRYVQQTLDSVQPASIHWMYIFQVDRDLGRSNPGIEYALNFLNLGTFEEFAEVMASADIDYTSRCVSRLFGYSIESLEPLFRSLDVARRDLLLDLAT